jgi:GntR family transcriptional regulator
MATVTRYLAIASQLESEIRAGTFAPLERVPSRVELSELHSVNVGTAGRAHAYLAERGYLVSRPGIGMRVLPEDRWQADQP